MNENVTNFRRKCFSRKHQSKKYPAKALHQSCYEAFQTHTHTHRRRARAHTLSWQTLWRNILRVRGASASPKALARSKPTGIKLATSNSKQGRSGRAGEREARERENGWVSDSALRETKTKHAALSMRSLLTFDISAASARESWNIARSPVTRPAALQANNS